MIEVDVIKIDLKGVCRDIKRMTLEDFKTLRKQPNFIYRAFQLGYHQFKIGI